MSPVHKAFSIIVVLGAIVNSFVLTRAIVLDRPVYLAVISAAGLTACLISTVVMISNRR